MLDAPAVGHIQTYKPVPARNTGVRGLRRLVRKKSCTNSCLGVWCRTAEKGDNGTTGGEGSCNLRADDASGAHDGAVFAGEREGHGGEGSLSINEKGNTRVCC